MRKRQLRPLRKRWRRGLWANRTLSDLQQLGRQPRRWEWFPACPMDPYHQPDVALNRLVRQFTKQYFAGMGKRPLVVWSFRMRGDRPIAARTYHWGIVLNRKKYVRMAKSHRPRWLRGTLKHELLHWYIDWSHGRVFEVARKTIGAWP